MNKIIYIANTDENDNINANNPVDVDMFDIEIPKLNTISEVPPLPNVEPTPAKTEIEHIADKSFISFGTMFICIAIILIFAFIYKKRKEARQIQIQEEEDNTSVEETESDDKEEISEQEEKPAYSPRKRHTTLSTPESISKCIKAFLDITKNI